MGLLRPTVLMMNALPKSETWISKWISMDFYWISNDFYTFLEGNSFRGTLGEGLTACTRSSGAKRLGTSPVFLGRALIMLHSA